MKNTVTTEEKTKELTVVRLDVMVVRGSYSKRNPQAIVMAKMTGMLATERSILLGKLAVIVEQVFEYTESLRQATSSCHS